MTNEALAEYKDAEAFLVPFREAEMASKELSVNSNKYQEVMQDKRL